MKLFEVFEELQVNEEKRAKFMEYAGKRVNNVLHDIQILEPMARSNASDFTKEDVEETYSQFKGNFITILSDKYPYALKNIYRPPFVLFYQGNIDLLNHTNKIALVAYDNKNEELLSDIDNACFITSGYANTFNVKEQIRVLTCGIDNSITITDNSLLMISENYSQTKDIQDNGYYSGRIAIALCDKVLVLNAKHSKNEAYIVYATENNKDIFVVPMDYKEKYCNNERIYEGALPLYTTTLLDKKEED